MLKADALMITREDNVATSLRDAAAGSDFSVRVGNEILRVRAIDRIPFGFKLAVGRILKGESVIKYGEAIGVASQDIEPGQLVHIHNIEGARGRGDLAKG
jgi:altronate dehydratase small subunit